MIRFLLCVIELVIYFVLMLPVMLIALIIRGSSKKDAHRLIQDTLRWEFLVLMWITGCNVTVNGEDNIPIISSDGMSIEPCLFIANHRSVFDIVMAYAYTKQLTAFVGKKEAKGIPLVGWLMALMNGVFLDRKDLKQGLESIQKAQSLIKDDRISVWIFPEGTRSKGPDERELLELKPGSFRVATKTGAPIVPVFISGTRDIFENHVPFVRACDVSITYGKPIWPNALDDEDKKRIGEYFRNVLLEM